VTIAELIAHLSRIRDQDVEITIRIQHHQLGQRDLDIIDILCDLDHSDHAYYVLEHEDPWADEEYWPEDPDTEELL
jgi:hypothetical protein